MTVRAPAKINLNLRVVGVRGDGYHELRTVFQSIALADTLSFSQRNGPFSLTSDDPDVPLNDRNLVWRAAACLAAFTGRANDHAGVRVAIRKRIPLQAGLGGGSADAAATLITLARMWKARVPAGALLELAASLGADVPFLLSGGTALGCGRGDEIRPVPAWPLRWVVLACPPFGVPTAEAYRWFDEDGARATAGRTVDLASRAPGRSRGQPLEVANDLEPCVARRHPVIAETAERLREAGAEAAAMSGSGSAVFGLFESAGRARRAAKRLARPAWTVCVTRTLTRAEVAIRLRPRARA